MTFDCPCWPPAWPEIEVAATEAIRSGDWGRYHSDLGRQLQSRLRDELSVKALRLCCSGTAALEIALRAAQIGNGDEVIVAAYDFPGNFRTIELVDATPVLIDVVPPQPSERPELMAVEAIGEPSLIGKDPRNAPVPALDFEQLQTAASERVRAVIVSHLHGTIANAQAIRQVCDERGWTLIEDVCQAIGGRHHDQPLGTFGHLATFSFGGSKLVSAGSGGAIVANDSKHGARLGGWMDRPGDTFPLSPLQAAVIGPQLDRLRECNQIRCQTAGFLTAQVMPQLPGWLPIDQSTAIASGVRAFYKYAWLLPSKEIRQRVIQVGREMGLPLGEGFRSMGRCSPRRCRKPVPTPVSDVMGERLVLLDHRALMVQPEQHESLADALRQLHRRVTK